MVGEDTWRRCIVSKGVCRMTKMMTKMMAWLMASLPAPVTEVDGRLLPISVVDNARRGIVARGARTSVTTRGETVVWRREGG